MKKLLTAIILIMIGANVYAWDNDYSCGYNDTSGTFTSGSTCSYGWTKYWHIGGVYNNSEDAYNDAKNLADSLDVGDCSHTWTGLTGPIQGCTFASTDTISSAVWCRWSVTYSRCCSTGTNTGHTYYFLYPNETWIDENEDCISDEDPDDEDYFHVSGSITDVNGTCYYYARLFTSNGNFVDYGDSSAFAKLMNGDIDGTIHYYSTYPIKSSDTGEYLFEPDNYFGNIDNVLPACNYEGGLLPSDEDENSGSSEDTELADNKDLDDGTDSSGNTTDSENIATTADNTAVIANNQQEISNQLTEIANQIKAQRNDLKDKAKEDSEAYKKMNNSLDGIENRMDQWNEDAETAYNDLESEINNQDTETIKAENEFSEDDEYSIALDDMIGEVSPDGTIGGVIDKYKDNEILNGFASSAVQITNPDCCIEIPFSAWGYSTNFEINACPFEDQLRTFGNLFYIITTIGCWIMIFRG